MKLTRKDFVTKYGWYGYIDGYYNGTPNQNLSQSIHYNFNYQEGLRERQEQDQQPKETEMQDFTTYAKQATATITTSTIITTPDGVTIQNILPAYIDTIRLLMKKGEKVAAIKLFRAIYSISLRDAKLSVEAIYDIWGCANDPWTTYLTKHDPF